MIPISTVATGTAPTSAPRRLDGRLFTVLAVAAAAGAASIVPYQLATAPDAVAAIGFGVAHLPAVAAVVTLDGVVVARTIGLNALLGTAFGVLYWRHGLGAAMAAHLAADLVIQTAAWALA